MASHEENAPLLGGDSFSDDLDQSPETALDNVMAPIPRSALRLIWVSKILAIAATLLNLIIVMSAVGVLIAARREIYYHPYDFRRAIRAIIKMVFLPIFVRQFTLSSSRGALLVVLHYLTLLQHAWALVVSGIDVVCLLTQSVAPLLLLLNVTADLLIFFFAICVNSFRLIESDWQPVCEIPRWEPVNPDPRCEPFVRSLKGAFISILCCGVLVS
jgi:hypothetical protein